MPGIAHRIFCPAWLLCALLGGGFPAQEAHAACQCTRTPGVPSCCDWNCQFLPADTVCRPALAPCDVADTCSGTSADCPDRYAPAGTTCSASPPATCSGTSPSCLTASGQPVGQPTYCAAPELGVPQGLTATAGNAQVALSWTAVLGSARYNVKRGLSSNSFSTVASPTSSSFTDTGVTNLTTYYYAVSAVNGQSGVESNNSATVSATPAVLPAPANLVALAGNAQVGLSWGAVAGAASYRLVRNGATLNVGAVTAYTDGGLVNGTTYSYYVYASPAAGGEGAHSNTVTATPVGPPAPPTNLTATASGTQVNLTWVIPPTATSCNVLRSTVSGSGYTAVATGITGSSYLNTGLSTATTYYYVVQGANTYGTGAFSAQAQATTVPAAPAGLAAAGGTGQITISWPVAPTATSYNLLRSTTSGSGYLASSGSTGLTGTSFVNTGLPAGTTYYYVLEAVNAAGTSARSAQAQATTAAAAPAGLTWSSPSTTQIVVSWAAVAGATSYNLKRSAASGGPYATIAAGITAPATGYTDGALGAGTSYYYVASAVNAAGESANSTQIAAMTRPAAPTLYAPTAGNGSLALSWSAVAGAASYNLKRSTTSGGPYTVVAAVTTTSYTNTGLTNGVIYYYVVAAVDAAGEGPSSGQVSGSPVAPPPPPPSCSCPSGFTCKCGDNRCYSSSQQCP
jgi:fibronectin type 3 domain-containing protein